MNAKSTALENEGVRAKVFQKKLQARHCTHRRGWILHERDSTQTEYQLFLPAVAEVCTVLFHGTGNDALFCWEELILALLESGRAVFTFDLPGHGQNSSSILDFESLRHCGDFLVQNLPVLVPGARSFEGIGYSLGALCLGLDTRMPWDRLVLMAVPDQVKLSFRFLIQEGLSFVSKAFWQQLHRYGWSSALPAFGRFRRQRFPIRLPPSLKFNYPAFIAELFQRSALGDSLQQKAIPILLIFGDKDYLARKEYGKGLQKLLPRAEYREVQGANHFLLALHPQTRAIIMQWLPALTYPRSPAGN